jgi:hypothetical protein
MLAKKTSKNQITLPKEIVRSFPDADYFDVDIENDAIRLRPVRIVPGRPTLGRIREKVAKLGLTEKDVDEAIRWARGQKR